MTSTKKYTANYAASQVASVVSKCGCFSLGYCSERQDLCPYQSDPQKCDKFSHDEARYLRAGTIDDPRSTLYFTCPGCEAKNQDAVHRTERARVVQGVSYCVGCGDALVGDVVFKTLCKALDGVVTWGKARKAHELHASLMNVKGQVEFKIETTCNCHGEGKIAIDHPNFPAFFDALVAFVEDNQHFPAIKALVERDRS